MNLRRAIKPLETGVKIMITENFKAQVKYLSTRYAMPLATVRKWMVANNIQSFKDWVATYGPHKYKTNSESHDACLNDITNWILSK